MKNNIIREKRRLAFNFKRITPKIVRSLSSVLEQEVKDVSSKKDFYILYSVDTEDSSYESQSIIIFDENQTVGNQIVKKINMKFYTLDYSKNIEVQIVHSINDENLENFIMVSGDESTWVNGILVRLTGILNNSENQSKFYFQYGGWMLSVLWLIFIIEFFRLIPFDKINSNLVAFLTVGIPISTMLGSINLHGYFKKIWPTIELQMGPSHFQFASQKRNKIQWVMATIIIPILLAVIYDIIKNYVS